MVELYINGINVTEKYGISLGEQGVTTLMCPPPTKSYIENKSSASNGKTIYINSVEAPVLYDEREISLVFNITRRSQTLMLQSFNYLCNLLKKGRLDISTSLDTNVQYKLLYKSCSQLQTYFKHVAKFTIKFTEANPADRDNRIYFADFTTGNPIESSYNGEWSEDNIYFNTTTKSFNCIVEVGEILVQKKWYASWNGYETYQDDFLKPYDNVRYVCKKDGKTYTYNGTTLVAS